MTGRSLQLTAAAIATSMQVAMVTIYGSYTDWCFCAVLTSEPSIPPPPFMMRFMELAVLPATRMAKGQPVELLFAYGLVVWSVVLLALLVGMTLAARLRVGRAPAGRRIRLAGQASVRAWHLLLIGSLLVGGAMAGGAAYRQRWLSQAEAVFAATMSAAGAGRSLPPGVDFSMDARRGDDFYPATPHGRFETRVDAHKAGDHFLDRFVVPYEYGGILRFESGDFYEFDVYTEKNGWNVDLHQRFARARRE
jgi:hypothetical protein